MSKSKDALSVKIIKYYIILASVTVMLLVLFHIAHKFQICWKKNPMDRPKFKDIVKNTKDEMNDYNNIYDL